LEINSYTVVSCTDCGHKSYSLTQKESFEKNKSGPLIIFIVIL
jgi:hypothetical protein